jgi:cell division protease FtsH
MPKNNFKKSMLVWIFTFFAGAVLVMALNSKNTSLKAIDFNNFIEKVKQSEVASVTFSGNIITGKLKAKDATPATDFKTYGDTKSEYFLKILGENNITPNYIPEDKSGDIWESILGGLFPILILFAMGALLVRFLKNNQGGISKFGKSNVSNIQDKSTVKFADVAGMDEAKEELTEIVDFLKNPKKYTNLGGKIPKGALLIGDPGTGKTMIAKAIANEAGVPFFPMSGSEFIEMFVGVGASRVKDLFNEARKNAPSIIFIDEIDAVAKHRASGQFGGSNSETDNTLNQLLVEMDGVDEKNGQIIVLGATNRPDVLDPALLRPGRFDRRVTIPRPDVAGRVQILKSHAKNKKFAESVDFNVLAKNTVGMSGADLQNLLNESAIMAARKDLSEITMHVIEEAKDKILMGTERKSVIISKGEKEKTAYHEAGHALISKILNLHTVHKVTIIPRGNALGVTQITPDDDQTSLSKPKALDYICMLMGGRAAEEVKYSELTTGASDDIKRATTMARRMVTEWGMSNSFGPMNLVQQGNALEGETLSADTKKIIDDEVKDILTSCYKKTKDYLQKHLELLTEVANLLVEKETISGDDISKLMVQFPIKV